MKKQSILFIGLVLAVLAVFVTGIAFAATVESQDKNPEAINPALTISIDKTETELHAGESAEFIIPAKPATGYRWVVKPTDGLNVTEGDFREADYEEDMFSVGSWQLFTITAEKAGTYTFTVEYKQPWDEETAPASTFTQTIVVKDATGSDTAEKPVYVVSFDGIMNPQVHDVVKITVPDNPTTGYDWNLTQTEGLTILKDEYLPDEHEESMVGVGGRYVWYVTTDTAGTYTFGAEYKRSWEDGAADQFAVNLTFIA